MFGTCSGFPAPELLETHAALLRARCERPRSRTAEQRDELAPALTMNNIVVVPISTGVGIRLGANVGYLKFTPTATWNPF